MKRLRTAALGLAVAAVLTGCAARPAPGEGSATGSAAPSPSATASASAPLVSPAPGASAGIAATLRIVRSGTPALPGPRWALVGVSADGRSVTIEWGDAVALSCGAVDEAVVTETDSRVVVALGRHAHAGHVLCPLVLALRHTTIPLQSPLGDRSLLEPEAAGSSNLPRATCPPRTPGAESTAAGVEPRYACPLTPGA